MVFSSLLCLSHFHPQIGGSSLMEGRTLNPPQVRSFQTYPFDLKRICCNWSFIGGSGIVFRPQIATFSPIRKSSKVHASYHDPCGAMLITAGFATSQIASNAFTLGTVAVLPFYTLMVVAPKAELTKKTMESSIPYIMLGILYAYLLYLSWTPETMNMIFASKYWLPELAGIAKMFTSEMTLASAWIHLLAIDLYAARQVFYDGLENQVETRHSISLCLFFCPIGVIAHFITKALNKKP